MIILIFAVLGLCFGSFVNALVYRLREQSKARKAKGKKAKTVTLSIVNGRSMCPHCRHTLAARDLLPVFSWLALGGKCRYCRKPISIQYPLVELATAALFIISFLAWPHGFEALGLIRLVLWLAVVVGCVALTIYDLKWMIMPNAIVYPLIGLAAVHALTGFMTDAPFLVTTIKLLSSLAVGSGLFYVLFQLSGGKWIGGGDVKFGAVFALLVAHPVHSALVIFLASLTGCLVLLPALLTRRTRLQAKVPFGPLLIVGLFLVYLWGDSIADWYLATILGY